MRLFRSLLFSLLATLCACATSPEPAPADQAAETSAPAPATVAVAVAPIAEASPPPAVAAAPRDAPTVAPAAPASTTPPRKLDDFSRLAEPQGGALVYRPLRRKGVLVGMLVGGYLHLSFEGRRHTLAVEYPSGTYRGRDSQAVLKTGGRLRPAYDPLKRCMSQRVKAQLTLSAGGTLLAREALEMSTDCTARKG